MTLGEEKNVLDNGVFLTCFGSDEKEYEVWEKVLCRYKQTNNQKLCVLRLPGP